MLRYISAAMILQLIIYIAPTHASTTFKYTGRPYNTPVINGNPQAGEIPNHLGSELSIIISIDYYVPGNFTGNVAANEISKWSITSGSVYADSTLHDSRLNAFKLQLLNGAIEMWAIGAAKENGAPASPTLLTSLYYYKFQPGYYYQEVGQTYYQTSTFVSQYEDSVFYSACLVCGLHGAIVSETVHGVSFENTGGTWERLNSSPVPELDALQLTLAGMLAIATARLLKFVAPIRPLYA